MYTMIPAEYMYYTKKYQKVDLRKL